MLSPTQPTALALTTFGALLPVSENADAKSESHWTFFEKCTAIDVELHAGGTGTVTTGGTGGGTMVDHVASHPQ